MKVELTKEHNLKENCKSYKAGDTENVSRSIAKRLEDGGIAKELKPEEAKKETHKKESKTK